MQPALPGWGPVLALAGLHAAVSLAWVAYNLYLVDLLVRAGFEGYLATVLLVVEGLVGGLIPAAHRCPVGPGADRDVPPPLPGDGRGAAEQLPLPRPAGRRRERAARTGDARPWLLVAWALSTAVFRAPALSLLARHARPDALPLAASVLTGAGALVGAAAPPGAVAVARAGTHLRGRLRRAAGQRAGGPQAGEARGGGHRASPVPRKARAMAGPGRLAPPRRGDGPPRSPFASSSAGCRGRKRAGCVRGDDLNAAFFAGMALAAVPTGAPPSVGWAVARSSRSAASRSSSSGSVLVSRVDGATAVLLVSVLLGAALAAVQNGLLAWSLCAVRAERSGLGLGLLLGGGGLALGAFNLLLSVRTPAPGSSLLAAAGLYALTLLLLAALRRTVRTHPVH